MDRERLWLVVPQAVRSIPADLLAVLIILTIANISIILPKTPAQPIFAFVLLVLLPGYVATAALFPVLPELDGRETSKDVNIIERIAISTGLSLAIVPVIGLILNYTPWGIRTFAVLISLDLLVLSLVGVATARRRNSLTELQSQISQLSDGTSADEFLNLLLVASILVAGISVSLSVAIPTQSEPYTEFYLSTDSNQPSDSNYPTNLTFDESAEVVIGVNNHEKRKVNYTIVVISRTLERVDRSIKVTEETRQAMFESELGHNSTWKRSYTIEAADKSNQEFIFLLYIGSSPAKPSINNSYRHTKIEVMRPDTRSQEGNTSS